MNHATLLRKYNSTDERMISSKGIALVDSDDVLVSCAPLMNALLNQIGGQASVEDYTSYDFPSFHGLTNNEMKAAVDADKTFLKMELLPKAREAMKLLKDNGYEVRIITSRGAFKDALSLTLQYYLKQDVLFDSIDIVDPRIEKKSDIYSKYLRDGVTTILFDDSIANLEDALSVNVKPLCIRQPWNEQDPLKVDRFDSFYDAVTSLLSD